MYIPTHAAYESAAFDVQFKTDYETGNLTITVKKVGELDQDDS